MSVCVNIRTNKKLEAKDIFKSLADGGEKIVVVSDFPSIHFGTHTRSLRGIEINEKNNGYEVRVCSFANEADLLLYGKTISVLMRLSGGKAYMEDNDEEEIGNPIDTFGKEWIDEQLEISANVNSALARHYGTPVVMEGLFVSFCFGPRLAKGFGLNLRKPTVEKLKEIQEHFTSIQWYLSDKKDTSTRMLINNPKDEDDTTLSVSMISVKDGKVTDFDYVSYADLLCLMNIDTKEMNVIPFEDAWKIVGKGFQMIDEYQLIREEECSYEDFKRMNEQAKLFKVEDLFYRPTFPGTGYDEKQRTFILMWNPEISSVKLEDYNSSIPEMMCEHYNWSVWEHDKARKGDRFFLVRCGNGNTGIVLSGIFDSNPYQSGDWSGKGRKVFYMDMTPNYIADPEKAKIVTTKELQNAIPTFEWGGGRSGRMLTEEQAKALEVIWHKYLMEIEDKIDEKVINANRIEHWIEDE